MLTEWRPITDYEVNPADLADKELRALSAVWLEQRNHLEQSEHFKERLKREWAIETGLIERLYTIERGVIELMIERGIDVALVPRNMTGDPARVAALIGDQKAAIDGIFTFVKGNRTLTVGYIKELHGLFTRNQKFVEGFDQTGRKTRIPLISGDYKKLPNNPTRPDGTVHPYCDPMSVASEMDRLMDMHKSHTSVAPEVEAAWLHHRFTQIHPFQDGNGRVARALATLLFVKESWLPLVIRDRARADYIDALEEADDGNLKPLVGFFAKLQRQEFLKVIGIARDVEKSIRVDERIGAIRKHLAQRRVSLAKEWESAKSKSEKLHKLTKQRMDQVCSSLKDNLDAPQEFDFFTQEADDDAQNSHYFMRQIISTAKSFGYYANTQPYRSWVRLVIKDGSQSNILISFHVLGYEFQGILACSATWFQRTQTDEGERESSGEAPLCDEIFQINYKENMNELKARFQDWLETVLERGLALWERDIL